MVNVVLGMEKFILGPLQLSKAPKGFHGEFSADFYLRPYYPVREGIFHKLMT